MLPLPIFSSVELLFFIVIHTRKRQDTNKTYSSKRVVWHLSHERKTFRIIHSTTRTLHEGKYRTIFLLLCLEDQNFSRTHSLRIWDFSKKKNSLPDDDDEDIFSFLSIITDHTQQGMHVVLISSYVNTCINKTMSNSNNRLIMIDLTFCFCVYVWEYRKKVKWEVFFTFNHRYVLRSPHFFLRMYIHIFQTIIDKYPWDLYPYSSSYNSP